MGARRKFTAEYKREAVGILDAPGVAVSQITSDLGIGTNILGRWRHELRQAPKQAFVGNGRSRDEEVSQLRREVSSGNQGAGFFARSGWVLRESVEVKLMKFRHSTKAYLDMSWNLFLCHRISVPPYTCQHVFETAPKIWCQPDAGPDASFLNRKFVNKLRYFNGFKFMPPSHAK